MFAKHPRDLLLRAAHGALEAAERAPLDAHLARCPRCRRRLAEVERAARALAAQPHPSPPVPLRERLLAAARDARGDEGAPRAWPLRPGWRPLLVFAGGAAVAIAGILLFASTEDVRVVEGQDAPTAFEALALSEHRDLRAERPRLDLVSDRAATIRSWLAENGGLSAALVEGPEPDEAGRAVYLGVRRAGSLAATVAMRIDGQPVTLLVGRARDVPGLPSWTSGGKQLLARRDPATAAHLLSWRNAGKAYTLVIEVPDRPERACLVCHDGARRRATIARVAEQL